jgi:parallel beta helix pectate lyase-like protein
VLRDTSLVCAVLFPFHVRTLLLVVIGCTTTAMLTAQSPNGTIPGAVRTYATFSSIGIEWGISGDANHNATATVEFRQSVSGTWQPALPLVRVDYNASNMLAGSIVFQSPNIAHEVRLTLNDPDGGAEMRSLIVWTRPLPALPTGGRVFHVVPGSGGGDGSSANPFRGIGAAQAAAQPRDTFLLHGGSYGGRIAFTRPGASGQYLVWKAVGDGEALFAGVDVYASHVWLEGLTLRDQPYALMSKGAPSDVVISRSTFINNHYSIYLQQGGRDWYIADNTIVGDTPTVTESFDGEGIELNGGFSESYGHVVAHNSITKVADGNSNGDYNIDVFGNDIFDTSDDGFEGDPGGVNIRVWGNRIHNAAHNGISFQPQEGSPWYILRNQLVSFKEAPFKFRTTDRLVIAHNTIVMWGKMICCSDFHLLRSIVKNNLWVSVSGGQIWDFGSSIKDWRTDFNNDGFDWGGSSAPFRYGGVVYSSLSGLAAASGLETSGRQINKNTCFQSFNVPGPPLTSVPPQLMTLKAGCNAIDAGAVLSNINDRFLGAGPDLGAYEFGQLLPTYGPRLGPQPPQTPTGLKVVS